jgi:hypothetical protein
MTDEELMAAILGKLSPEELEERIVRARPHIETLKRELGGDTVQLSRIVEAIADDAPSAPVRQPLKIVHGPA